MRELQPGQNQPIGSGRIVVGVSGEPREDFEAKTQVGAVLLGATLPDIDHPRSPIGRLFLPLSRYLNSRHGHRTLTHSLLGLGIFWLAAGLLEQTLWQSQRLTAIAVIAMVSHLLFDMVTLQGVLLFLSLIHI